MKKSVIFGAITGGIAVAILAVSILFGTGMAVASKEDEQTLSDYEIACNYVDEKFGEGHYIKMLPLDDEFDEFINFLVFDENDEAVSCMAINRLVYGK